MTKPEKATAQPHGNPIVDIPDTYSLGVALHTALRKCCDSVATSLVYNIVHMCREGWILYLEYAWEALEESTPKTVALDLRAAAQRLEWGDTQRNALRISLSMMDDADFEAMAAFIWNDDAFDGT